MYKPLFRSALVIAVLLAAATAGAADLAPGNWEITMETRVAGAAGFAPPPVQITQCLTTADARDPSRLMESLSSQGASDCKFTDWQYSGNRVRFAMACSGNLILKSRGEVVFSADRFSGTIDTDTTLNDTESTLHDRVYGRLLGPCAAP
ncbi:MAG TPA: DUF3617 family protein [Rhodocyclaceae bacterium]